VVAPKATCCFIGVVAASFCCFGEKGAVVTTVVTVVAAAVTKTGDGCSKNNQSKEQQAFAAVIHYKLVCGLCLRRLRLRAAPPESYPLASQSPLVIPES